MKLRNRPRLFGTLVGYACSLVAMVLLLGLGPSLQGNFLDRPIFDWRARDVSTIEAHPDIVHLDIDNGAIYEHGRWPWTRRQIADLLKVISDAGVKYILVDLLISEPEAPYLQDAGLNAQYLIDEGAETVGSPSPVYGDLELLQALRAAGNVIMAAEFEYPSARGGAESSDKTPDTELIGAVATYLVQNFSANIDSAADALELDAASLRRVWARSKRLAARRMVAQVLADDPDASLGDVRLTALGNRAGAESADDQDLKVAYREAKGRLDMIAAAEMPTNMKRLRALRSARRLIPILWPLRPALVSAADVNFEADEDGVVRRVPPLITYKGRLFAQLGVAAAIEIQGLDLAAASVAGKGRLLQIPRKGGGAPLAVPLDERGNMLIPWTCTGKDWRKNRDFPHITAGQPMAIADARRVVRDNSDRLQYLWAEAVKLTKGTTTREVGGRTETIYGGEKYRQLVNQMGAVDREWQRAQQAVDRDAARITKLEKELQSLRAAVATAQGKCEKEARYYLRKLTAQPKTGAESPQPDEATQRRLQEIRAALSIIENDIPAVHEATRKEQAKIDEQMTALRSRLAGKYVFVGFAATAQGDIVSTPIDPNTNGVMCHANVLNAFLQNRFITQAPVGVELLVCALLVGLVAPITATRSPGFALAATSLLAALFAVINVWWLFRRHDYAMAGLSIIAVMFLCWSVVTLFRQFTAERDKRLFRGQLSQYTSPAIAARIAESPDAARAFKVVQTRDMTCYFSDLAGFTTISEQEDAEVIQTVLNVYLERMSDTIWSYRGLINKFMGDGIMAIYNPSVDPLDAHPLNACESALASIEALESLKQERRGTPEARVFENLFVRIGLATGACKNGDMGSELKADYTVIGDVVNLAARLEPANKVFGTQIMISGPTYERVRDAFEVRYLAELQVKGKSNTVPVYELCDRKGKLAEEQVEYIRRFEAGVELYKARRWDECIVHFTRMLARQPDDPGAARYIDACQEMKAFPPADDWAGALELKEK